MEIAYPKFWKHNSTLGVMGTGLIMVFFAFLGALVLIFTKTMSLILIIFFRQDRGNIHFQNMKPRRSRSYPEKIKNEFCWGRAPGLIKKNIVSNNSEFRNFIMFYENSESLAIINRMKDSR